MKKSHISLSDLNSCALENVSGQNLDFVNVICQKDAQQFGIIGYYLPRYTDSGRFVKLNSSLDVVNLDKTDIPYYGLSPRVDNKMIVEQISTLRLATINGLDQFVKEHCEQFMLHDYQAKYLHTVARYLILSLAYNFSVNFLYDEELKNAFAQIVNRNDHTVTLSGNILRVRGCPTVELIDVLGWYRFKKTNDGLWKICDGGDTVDSIYRVSSNITLANGHVFYSGTLFRPIKFKLGKNTFENVNTETVICYFEQTSYATVFAFDNNFSAHPLLYECRDQLTQLFDDDNRLKRNLFTGLENCDKHNYDTETRLKVVNQYLASCINVNQIGVSSNLTTSDGFFCMGVRSAGSIDSGSLYPAINGNAEIADENVSFYRWNAVQEDYPSIKITESKTIRFGGEIQREASEELQIEADVKSFKTCALIISGDTPSDANALSRRMHFNILYDYQCNKSFDELAKQGVKANEAFENQHFIGIRLNLCDGWLKMFAAAVGNVARLIIENTDFWESVLLLTMSTSLLFTIGFSQFHTPDWIQFFLAFLVIIVDLYKCFRWIRQVSGRKKFSIKIIINTRKDYARINTTIRKALAKFSYHPVAIAALLYHIQQRINSNN